MLSLFSCPVKFTIKYELNALRLLSSHVPPPHDVRAFAVLDCSWLAPNMDQGVSDSIGSDMFLQSLAESTTDIGTFI